MWSYESPVQGSCLRPVFLGGGEAARGDRFAVELERALDPCLGFLRAVAAHEKLDALRLTHKKYTAPSRPSSPKGSVSPRSSARIVGRPTCASTSRRTPARSALFATSSVAAWPPTPPAKRMARDQPAASANMRRAPRAQRGKR